MRRSAQKILAVLLLLAYFPLVVTLDLHHNHTGEIKSRLAPGIVAVDCCDDHDDQVCPVLQFTLAHEQINQFNLPQSDNKDQFETASVESILFVFIQSSNARSPPVFS